MQVTNPMAPLEVNGQVLISNSVSGPAQLHLKAYEGQSYIRWSDPGWNPGTPNLGALGYPYGGRDLVYRAMGSDASTGGQEVFRIKSDSTANSQFIIGAPVTGQPREKSSDSIISPWLFFKIKISPSFDKPLPPNWPISSAYSSSSFLWLGVVLIMR